MRALHKPSQFLRDGEGNERRLGKLGNWSIDGIRGKWREQRSWRTTSWLVVLFRRIEFVESNDLGGIFEKNMEYSFNM